MECRVLGESDRRAVLALIDADPVLNVFVASRLEAGVLDAHAPGELWGYPADEPRCLFHVGANLVPLATDAEARRAFARQVGPYRVCSAIVGVRAEALDLWQVLGASWPRAYGNARAVRDRQPVLAADRVCPIDEDPRVVPVTAPDFESYFEAAVAMYTEELEEDPLRTNPQGYRRYVRSLLESGRAFGIVLGGRVVFKADIGAVGHGVAQIQGVWLHPALRGRGLAAPAMAAVTNRIVRAGQVASLYVNDFNSPALATYRRCGYTERGVFSTVLY